MTLNLVTTYNFVMVTLSQMMSVTIVIPQTDQKNGIHIAFYFHVQLCTPLLMQKQKIQTKSELCATLFCLFRK